MNTNDEMNDDQVMADDTVMDDDMDTAADQSADEGQNQGKIKWFNPTKGFGFIGRGEGKDIFLHISNLADIDPFSLQEGDVVTFDVEEGDKGLFATNVKLA